MSRINQYPECTTPDNNDWLLIETSEGTKKVKKSTLLKAVVDLLGNEDISEIGDGTVTGAIADLNNDLSKNKVGTSVNIASYESTSNMYTFPSDGYVCAVANGPGQLVELAIYDADGASMGLRVSAIGAGTGAYMGNSLFVRKGMKVYVLVSTSSIGAFFVPLV